MEINLIENISIKSAEKFEKENDWLNALEVYKKLLEKDSDNINVLEKVGWCYSRLTQYNNAIDTFKVLIIREPKKAKWYYMVGYQYYSMKEWDIAIEFFRKALVKYPNYFIVKYRLGYALTQTSGKMLRLKSPNYIEAFKLFSECEELWSRMSDKDKIRERQHYADICFQKCKILIERCEWDGAISSIKKSIDIDRNNIDYNYNFSKALYGKGEYEQALKVIPNSCKYYINELKAEILSKLEDFDSAINIYTHQLNTRKRDYLFRQLGDEYLKKNDLKNAFINVQKAITLGPKNHKNYFTLGKIYLMAGLLISAKQELEKACSLKQNEYNSDYIEAAQLLDRVTKDINKNGIEIDDIDKLNILKNSLSDESYKLIKGKIKKYITDRGFGFIQFNNQECYFHISDVFRPHQNKICEGTDVIFSTQESTKGPTAKNIKVFYR